MPKERVITYIPTTRLTQDVKNKIGLKESWINSDIRNLKDLIIKLRHSVAHFDITVESHGDKKLIDEIIFKNKNNGTSDEIVKFKASELLPFINYYSDLLLNNIKKYRQNNT